MLTLHRRNCVLRSLVLVSAVTVALTARPAHAYADERLSVSPAILERTVRPGEQITEQLTVRSDGSDPIQVEFQHADVGFNEAYEPQFLEDDVAQTVPFSTRGWFSVPQRRFTIGSRSSITVPLRITVPENATPGTHLGAAFFRTIPAEGTADKTGVMASARTGPIVILALAGGADPKPVLRRFGPSGLQTDGRLRPLIEVGNHGEQHFSVEGTVTLRGRGKRWREPTPRRLVLPNRPRAVRDEQGEPILLGSRNAPMGRYTLEVELLTDPGSVRLRQRRVIWVVPVWARLGGAVVALSLVVGAMFVIRRFRTREVDEDDTLTGSGYESEP